MKRILLVCRMAVTCLAGLGTAHAQVLVSTEILTGYLLPESNYLVSGKPVIQTDMSRPRERLLRRSLVITFASNPRGLAVSPRAPFCA
jgi:hypothetical protein